MKRPGLLLSAFYIEGCKTYYNAIRTIFGGTVAIQYDYFHVMQNVWNSLRKWTLDRRRRIKERAEESWTPWYQKKLRALAKSLWENPYLLFKADERLSETERKKLAELVEAEGHVGRLRAFLGGVWDIFENSRNEAEARLALARLKRMSIERAHPEALQQIVRYLGEHFDWMTAYLRHDGVRRNSLAESGMRKLRRLEIEHDGFRSKQDRENALRIYQAIKHLGWSVHRLPQPQAESV